jgi:hypothetical protein
MRSRQRRTNLNRVAQQLKSNRKAQDFSERRWNGVADQTLGDTQ